MNNRNLIIGIVLLVVIAGGGGLWWWQSQAETSASDKLLEATGVIEARQVSLAPEIGGQVVEVLVEEGQRVTAGQPVVRLDDSQLTAKRAQAQAALQAAQADLARLKAGATADQIRAAEARLAQAEANLRMAQANLDALTARSRPEEIAAIRTNLNRARTEYRTMRVKVTTKQIEKVRSALITAEGNLFEANAWRDNLAEDIRNPDYVIAAAEAAVADGQAAVDAAREVYEAVMDESLPYSRQIGLARLSWEAARANLTKAQARRDRLADDPRTPSDALYAADVMLQDARDQVAVTRAAYEALTSGTSAIQWNAAWVEVQRAQDQLVRFAAIGQDVTGIAAEIGLRSNAPSVRQNANLRRGPGTDNPVIGKLSRGETLRVLSRNRAGDWLQVETEDGQSGWVAAFLVQDAPNVEDLPVASELPSLSTGLNSSALSSVETLLAQVDAATALRDEAAASLSQLKSGARQEEIDAAQAQVDAARAQLDVLDIQLRKTTITAPRDGVVLTRSVEPGEVVAPGATLLEIGRLDSLKLTVYLPEDRFGLVTPGQVARVRVDAYPNRVFSGTVLRVSDEAEFTPTNIQTQEERVRLVYAVVINLDNPDLALKPGMIADVEFSK